MRAWLSHREDGDPDAREQHLVTMLKRLRGEFPALPLEILIRAILGPKLWEAYDEIGMPDLPDLVTHLAESARGLASLSIHLDPVRPFKLPSEGQLSWSEVGERLDEVSGLLQEWSQDLEARPLHLDGRRPEYLRNALLFVTHDVFKKSTGRSHYDEVADVFNLVYVSGEHGKPIGGEAVRKRIGRFKKLLLTHPRYERLRTRFRNRT